MRIFNEDSPFIWQTTNFRPITVQCYVNCTLKLSTGKWSNERYTRTCTKVSKLDIIPITNLISVKKISWGGFRAKTDCVVDHV